jgi:8-oxo-dGTP diphosphatase
MEIWDAYKIDGTLAGVDLIRGETIPDGLYHIVCEILVRHIDGSFLLMQRDFNKEGFPGKFEATAGGSALKGETPVLAAIRELKEETGIITEELKQINRTVGKSAIFYSFLCVTDCDKSSVILQEGETVSFRWISEDEFIQFMNSPDCIPPQLERLKPYLNSLS